MRNYTSDMENIIDVDVSQNLDHSSRLQITINNQKPVVLTDLTLSLLAIGQQFESFIENESSDHESLQAALFIKDVRSGSIIVELIAQAMPFAPLFWQGGSLLEWTNHAKSVVEWLTGKASTAPKDISKGDLRQWNNILEPIAKDNGSQLNIAAAEGATVITQFFVNSEQANAAQNAIRRYLVQLDEPSDYVHRKQVMFWSQTKFSNDGTRTGDRAVIESISKAPVKIIFENDAVKRAMLAGNGRFRKQWHELAYIVDVKVQTVRGVPKVFTVLNFYDEETFDPDE